MLLPLVQKAYGDELSYIGAGYDASQTVVSALHTRGSWIGIAG